MMTPIPFHTTDWSKVEVTEHAGETKGKALWRTMNYDGLRIRLVEYEPGYFANHWCTKGHIIFCLEGEMTTELKDGSLFEMKAGTSYQVSDDMSAHRSFTTQGAKLFIVDGEFLRTRNRQVI